MPYINIEHKKAYHAQYIRQHYQNNKLYYIDKAKKNDTIRIQKIMRFINRYKRRYGCSDCGIKNPIVLDFHHLRDKIKAVAILARSHAFSKVKDEIRKCILLCANCHRIHHHNEKLSS